MNDDTIETVATWIFWLAIIASGVFTMANVIRRTDMSYGESRSPIPWPWRWQIIFLIFSASAFLWSPWMALGIVKVYRANWNAVNYVNRPDTVTPVPGKVYRADAAPVEKP